MDDDNEEMKFCVPEDEKPYPSFLYPSELNTTIGPGPTSLLDKLHQVLGPLCDLDCWICKNYIHQLSQHIRAKHRSDGVEIKQESTYNQTQPNSSTVDFDLDSIAECVKSDDEIEEKYEPFLQELEVPAVPSSPIPQRKRGQKLKSLMVPEPIQTRKSLRTNVRRMTIVKKIKKEKVIKKVKKTPEEKIKSRQEKLTCTSCQKVFTTPHNLKVHLRTHTGEKPYKCGTCQKSFRLRHVLKLHEQVAHTGERPFVCTICSKAFRKAYALKVHVQSKHTREKPHKCEVCNRTFALRTNLNQHKEIHAGVKPFMCEICSARFVSNQYLKKHTKTHTGEKPFICDHCGKGFTTKPSLIYHIRCTHTKEQPSLPCDVCEQKFTDPKQLVLHKRIHTGEKVIQCEHCPKYFLKRKGSGLWQHMQSHRTENAFECDRCHKTYKTKSSLKKHSLKHTGVVQKSEKCEECGKSYDMPYLLRLHFRRVHNTQQQEQGDEDTN